MIKYCPIMSYQYQSGRRECLGKECAWADNHGNCLITRALIQITSPISTLAEEYHPTNQNILHEQPAYITHWVHRDTTTKVDEGWGGF